MVRLIKRHRHFSPLNTPGEGAIEEPKFPKAPELNLNPPTGDVVEGVITAGVPGAMVDDTGAEGTAKENCGPDEAGGRVEGAGKENVGAEVTGAGEGAAAGVGTPATGA